MKKFLPFLSLLVLISGCDNIRSVAYTTPVPFQKNILYLKQGSYAAVRPDVPLQLKDEATELLNESFSELLGSCYVQDPILQATEFRLNTGKIPISDLDRIKFQQPDLDYLIYLRSSYKEPVITEFTDSRNFHIPEEHVTGRLTIFDLATNELVYEQVLIGSTEEPYDPYDPYGENDDDITFRAAGDLLTVKVLKRLIRRVAKNASTKGILCN